MKEHNILIIKTNSELKPDIYEKTYGLLESMVNNGVLFLDNRFDYEVVEINKITLDNGDTKWYNNYTKVKKGDIIMTKEIKIVLLKERLNKLRNSSKDNDGVQRKLERQLRNLKK